MDKIVRALESHQVVLMKDIAMLDQMYELNTKYYKELTMYIIAGKSVSIICAPTTWSSSSRRPPPPAARRTPRPTTILPTFAIALRRRFTTWSSPA